jgi:aspartokinase/homoserine dehydrogenase 1
VFDLLMPCLLVGTMSPRVAVLGKGTESKTLADKLALGADGEPYDLDELTAALVGAGGPCRVFVDATARLEVTRCYDRLLASGVHVVTANKLRLAGPREQWDTLRRAGPGRLYYETTVGAGLPVISTIQSLLATGDRVRRIEGVLSGTLGYLAGELEAQRPFSAAVRSAHELGFTEPDPREDLSGRDVARKLLILARLSGRDLDDDEVAVEALLPDASWYDMTIEEFWRRLPELDASLAARQAAAARVFSDVLRAAVEA